MYGSLPFVPEEKIGNGGGLKERARNSSQGGTRVSSQSDQGVMRKEGSMEPYFPRQCQDSNSLKQRDLRAGEGDRNAFLREGRKGKISSVQKGGTRIIQKGSFSLKGRKSNQRSLNKGERALEGTTSLGKPEGLAAMWAAYCFRQKENRQPQVSKEKAEEDNNNN